jgi:hypothetical protein
LPLTHGSNSTTFPLAVAILNVLWPSQVILFPRVNSMAPP